MHFCTRARAVCVFLVKGFLRLHKGLRCFSLTTDWQEWHLYCFTLLISVWFELLIAIAFVLKLRMFRSHCTTKSRSSFTYWQLQSCCIGFSICLFGWCRKSACSPTFLCSVQYGLASCLFKNLFIPPYYYYRLWLFFIPWDRLFELDIIFADCHPAVPWFAFFF